MGLSSERVAYACATGITAADAVAEALLPFLFSHGGGVLLLEVAIERTGRDARGKSAGNRRKLRCMNAVW